MPRRSVLFAACAVSWACATSRPAPAPAPGSPSNDAAPPAAAAPTDAPALSGSPESSDPHTGALGESEFKRLHELRGDSAPARTGVDFELSDGSRAYLSLPPGGEAPLPALVVIHEWWGLNEHVLHWTDRLAREGYAALAVDLYGGEVATTPDRALELVKSVNPTRARTTLVAAHRFLAADPRVRARRRGAIGWCFGGKQALELALAAPDLDAAVVYYGHVPSDRAALAALRTPVLAIFGTRDASIPPAVVQGFDAALTELKVPHRVLTFDAEHAFANPSGARYDAAAAEAAWTETRAFLAERLRGSPAAK